jgi:hypothetical protein
MEAFVVAKSTPFTSRPAAAIDLTAPPAAVAKRKRHCRPVCASPIWSQGPTNSPSALEVRAKSGGSSSRDQRQRNRERVPPWRVRAPVCVGEGGVRQCSWPAALPATPRASLAPTTPTAAAGPAACRIAGAAASNGGGGRGVNRGFSTALNTQPPSQPAS